MTGSTAGESVVLQRELSAPPERVFDWLTEADKLARWMTPQGRAEAEADARPGGRLSVVMIGDGIRIEHSGEFIEVDARGDGTTLTLRHDRLTREQAESHAGGWSAILGRLASELSNSTLEV